MEEDYKNLSYVTLYNTHQFNKIDTLLFEDEDARDDYFAGIVDKIKLDEFTDLYEGRTIALPMNYLDCKKYNTMRLHYDDGLGHVTDYYCNVDNYQYVSSDTCTPIYRIDYFLTYGYLLYDKNINMITDRRTVKEANVTKYMKADEMSVPKLSYQEVSTSGNSASHCFVILLNKTNGAVGKKGITTTMQETIDGVLTTIDTHTIGTYILICNEAQLANRLAYESSDYVEKIIECNINPQEFVITADYNNYAANGYVYVTSDVTKTPARGYSIANFSDYKRILNRLPYIGFVVQGNEYDPNDFKEIFNILELYSQLICFNNFGYSFIFPINYKGEKINYDYMTYWQSGKNFSYTSDYSNSLSYKELLESNNQLLLYTDKNSTLNLNYNNTINNNANQQLDITKKQSNLSYESQISSQNTNISNLKLQTTGGLVGSLLSAASAAASGDYIGAIKAMFGEGIQVATNLNNSTLLYSQLAYMKQQKELQGSLIDLQKNANNINNNFQCDTIALARDNSIANISISNKYNNAKPGAYNQTDYSKYTNKLYIIGIDNKDGTDYTQYENLANHYNVEGISVGYLENWKPNVKEGTYFDYIKGSVIDNSNSLSDTIDYDIYLQLITRIENGIRIWYDLEWFGNLIVDNTYKGTPEPYNTLTAQEKRDLEKWILTYIYSNSKTQVDTLINNNIDFTTMEKSYCLWYNNELLWDVNPPTQLQKDTIENWIDILLETGYSKEYVTNNIKGNDFYTIYQIQYGITYINSL